ncbi:MAG: glycosyltransferase family 2 protein [Oscillospiraceae bacterium]|nr:glycosyltransferase family 2 protein [Oscillospiraceae bacterium]
MAHRAPRAAVIMPAFNAEKTIERTVRSILAQTMEDLVLIVVNDGSKAGTGAILEHMHAEDPRVRPIPVQNGGPARARNIALEAVPQGTEYLAFSDADDLLAPDALQYAIENAGDADLVLMGFSILNPDGSEAKYFEPAARYTPETIGPALGRLYKANLLNQVWGKLFKASLVLDNALLFPDYRWGEDRLFIYGCLEHAQSVTVLPACKYQYIMYPGESLITRYYDKKLDICVESDRRMEALCERFGVSDQRDQRYMFMKSVFSCLTTLFSPRCTLTAAQKRAEIRRTVTNERVLSRSRDVFGGTAVRTLCAVIRTKNVPLNYVTFRFVARAGTIAPRLFTKLKHRK